MKQSITFTYQHANEFRSGEWTTRLVKIRDHSSPRQDYLRLCHEQLVKAFPQVQGHTRIRLTARSPDEVKTRSFYMPSGSNSVEVWDKWGRQRARWQLMDSTSQYLRLHGFVMERFCVDIEVLT